MPCRPEGVDTSIPNVAQMYDYYLGGKNNFEADRVAADEIMQLVPEAQIEAISNRKFLRLAVRYLMTEAGIGQFLDIGVGFRPGRGPRGGPRGSYLVISHIVHGRVLDTEVDKEVADRVYEIYSQASERLYPRTPAQIARLLDGFELIEPEVMARHAQLPEREPPRA